MYLVVAAVFAIFHFSISQNAHVRQDGRATRALNLTRMGLACWDYVSEVGDASARKSGEA